MPYTPPAYDEEAGGEFEPLTPGTYVAVVEALELWYSGPEAKNPDSPYVAWTFTIAEGDSANRKVWNNTSWLPQAINMPTGWYSSLIACGLDVEDFEGDWDDEESLCEEAASAACGRMVELAIGNRRYEGKIQNDVVAIRAYEGEQLRPRRGRSTPKAEKEAEPAAAAKPRARGKKSDMDF